MKIPLVEQLESVDSRMIEDSPSYVMKLIDEAVDVLRSTEAVERDAARLDDMERTKCYPFWNGSCWTYIVAAERSSKIERKGMGATVREAIDAAMRPDVSDGKA